MKHTYSNSSGSASSEIMALPKISIYVYNKGGTVLYYIADNIRDLTDGLEIKESLLNKHLDNGTVYLKSFTFSRNLLPGAKSKLITLVELSSKVKKIREVKQVTHRRK